jgi:alpha-L-arabinofuranosidase
VRSAITSVSAQLPSFARRCICIGASLLALRPVSAAPPSPQVLAVDIDAAAPGTPVSPTLYGAFFEEINRAGDGGLYAEMLQNRSFEDAPEPVAWTLLKPAGAEASWSLDASEPLNANNPHSLRLNITRVAGGRVGIANDGFKGAPLDGKEATAKAVADWLPKFAAAAKKSSDGLKIRANEFYPLSFYARAGGGFNGRVTATLECPDGSVLARAEIIGIGAGWQKFTAALKPSADETNGRLVLATTATGTLWLDMVSLFPAATYKLRPNGTRRDLAGMMADLHPAFLRFPGGSFVEGLMLADAYRWKRTIGDVAARPGFQGIWGYRSTDGLGYHEYLQLCEDLGAEPLFVSNCGMSEKEFAPPDKMPEWIQDTLDAIEYANGPATSPWGAQRARNGHPLPFNLRYVEIGNENGLDYFWGGGNEAQYTERYRPIYQAIKARYPNIITIANSRADAPIEVLDEHYYETSEWFQEHATLYDHYDRHGPKIYVGEYAVTKGCGNGNLKAALGEAAFMTGLERNGDVVAMSSYAPLFANPAWERWHPDAVFFNAAHVYGTPSYHAQAMFAANRADTCLPLKISGGMPGSAPALFAVAGRRRATGELILKVVNPGSQPVSATINLHGGGPVAATGRALVMASPSAADENSFAEPAKVLPRDEPLTNAASSFRYNFRANSIAILRLQTRG